MFHPLQRGCKTCADKSGESLAGPALEGSATLLCLPSLVEFLLYRGKADLTVMDENKNTALHLACSKVLSALRVGSLGAAGPEERPGSADRAQGRQGRPDCLPGGTAPCAPARLLSSRGRLPRLQPSLSAPFPQGHEKCALMILAETQDLGLINATNSALQM